MYISAKIKQNQFYLALNTKSFSNTPRLLCNTLIQPLFDYALTTWFSNLSKRLKLCLHPAQSKRIRFCLQGNKRSKICIKEFLQLNWLNVHYRYLHFIVPNILKFRNDQCSNYFDEFFCPVGENGITKN